MIIDELQRRAHANAKAKGFYEVYGFVTGMFWQQAQRTQGQNRNKVIDKGQQFKTVWLLARLMLINTELAEAAEAMRKEDGGNWPEELADAFIRLLDLAEWTNVDLYEETLAKMERNESRPRMHGGKLA